MKVNKIKGLLREKGYTYKTFSEKIEMPLGTFQSILLRGKCDSTNLKKICEGLEVSSDYILGLKEAN